MKGALSANIANQLMRFAKFGQVEAPAQAISTNTPTISRWVAAVMSTLLGSANA
jgi:hypothetical protein